MKAPWMGHGGRARQLLVLAVLLSGLVVGGVALAAPPGGFSWSPDSPTAGQTVTFTAAADCGDDDVSCAWTTEDGAAGAGKRFSHAFAAAGSYTVSLTAKDADGVTQSSLVVAVGAAPPPPNQKPLAKVDVGVPRYSNQPIALDASGSSDPDGSIKGYAWQADDGGSIANPGAARTTVTWDSPGRHNVYLTVVDDDGAASDRQREGVLVANPGPTATFSASPPSPLSLQQVTFIPAASDPNGRITGYFWELDDAGTSGAVSPAKAYAIPGRKRIRLVVTDDDGATAEAVDFITVRNQQPTAEFTSAPNPAFSGQSVTLTARARDPEDRIDPDGYGWDLNNDGRYGDRRGRVITTTLPNAPEITVGLRVRDRDGGEATFRQKIIAGNRKPTAGITFAPASPAAGQAVTLSSTSTDPEGPLAKLEWDLDADGDYDDGTASSVSRTFPAQGTFTVALRATDGRGSIDVAKREVQVGGGASTGSRTGSFVSQGEPTPAGRRTRGGRMMRPFPVVRISGRVMRRGAMFRIVSVTAPSKARIAVRCLGRGCAFSKRQAYSARLVRLRRAQGFYRSGSRIEIRVTRPGYIGKYTVIKVRSGKAPTRQDRCLRPGGQRPIRCPTS